jgi:hypothetical protein
MWELGVEIRVRQSPDWRVAGRHSGEWRSRERLLVELNLNSQGVPELPQPGVFGGARKKSEGRHFSSALPSFGFQDYLGRTGWLGASSVSRRKLFRHSTGIP